MKTFQNKFKLTPDAYKKLKITAELLPKFQRKDPNGNLMFRVSTKFTGTEDFDSVKGSFTKKISQGREPLLVNHEVNLVQIYQKEGQLGVDAYVDFFMSQSKKQESEIEKKN